MTEKLLGDVGAKLLCGGRRERDSGSFVQPTLFSNGKREMKIAQEEIFGPVLGVMRLTRIRAKPRWNNTQR